MDRFHFISSILRNTVMSRKLTQNEIDMAKTVFGDAIDYDVVRINDKKYMFFQSKHVAMAPNGNLYMGAQLKSDDYALENSFSKRSLFIHEMAHVWQFQNKILHPLKTGVKLMVKHAFNYGAAYPYKLDSKKDLLEYNMEQQASIIQDYFLLNHQGVFRWQGNCKNDEKVAKRAAAYEKVLENFQFIR